MLLDASGQAVGQAERDAAYWINDIPMSWGGRWYEVRLRDGVIGQILAQRGARDPRLLRPKIPSVRPASVPLEREAELWLLALAIIEVAYLQVAHSKLRTRV